MIKEYSWYVGFVLLVAIIVWWAGCTQQREELSGDYTYSYVDKPSEPVDVVWRGEAEDSIPKIGMSYVKFATMMDTITKDLSVDSIGVRVGGCAETYWRRPQNCL